MAGEAHGSGGCLEQPEDIKKCVVKVAVADESWKAGGKGLERNGQTEPFNRIKGKLIISPPGPARGTPL